MTVEATLNAPGIVVLSEVSYPGWRVRVNGRPARPCALMGLLRAVALPAGVWRIEWRFVSLPTSDRSGADSVTVMGLLGFYVRRRTPTRSRNAQ